ncbi:hypothetical protein ACLOJK_016805 [Asimina triloba]
MMSARRDRAGTPRYAAGMRCISCRELYETCDAGTCKECYEEASETEEELKREIEDLKAKVAFLRICSPLDSHSRSCSASSFTDVVLEASDDDCGTGAPSVRAHKAILVPPLSIEHGTQASYARIKIYKEMGTWKSNNWQRTTSMVPRQMVLGGAICASPELRHLRPREGYRDPPLPNLKVEEFPMSCQGWLAYFLELKILYHLPAPISKSPVFKAMLENEMEESRSGTIKISDVSYDVLRSFVNYLYTAEAFLDEQMACELLVLAEKYQVKHLKAFSEKFITSKVNNDNAVMSFAFAHRHNAKNLLEASLSLITDNMDTLTERVEYKELVEKDPRLVVEIYEAYLAKQVNTAAKE